MKKLKEKNNLIIPASGAILLIVIAFFLTKGKKEKETTALITPTPAMSPYANSEEPEIKITIDKARTRGSLMVSGINENFKEVEYEFIYLSDYKGSLVERGVSSGGGIPITGGKLTKELVFGVESCTTGTCHFSAEEVETDEPATLILRFLDADSRAWQIEKTVTFELSGGSYTGKVD